MNGTWWPWLACLLGALVLTVAMSFQSEMRATHANRPAAPAVANSPRIRAPGQVEPARREAELVPEVAGRVLEVAVKQGDWVSQGDLLIRLDAADYLFQLALAKAELRAARADYRRLQNGARDVELRAADAETAAVAAELEQAEKTWKRHQQLARSDTISLETLERTKAEMLVLRAKLEAFGAQAQRLRIDPRPEDLDKLAARVEATQAGWKYAQLQVARADLRAPFDGEVLDLHAQVGELVRPLQSPPLIILGDTSRLRIRAWVEELDAARIQLDRPVHFTVDGLPGQVFAGTVAELSPRMRRKTVRTDRPDELRDMRTREVWIDLQDDQALVPGMHVDVHFSRPPTDAQTTVDDPPWVR